MGDRINQRKHAARKKIARYAFFVIITTLVLRLLFLTVKGAAEKSSEVISPLASLVPQNIRLVLGSYTKKRDTLETVVITALKDTKGAYAVVIKNLKTQEYYSLRENNVFEAASLYKLWIMATAYNQIEKGILREDEVLTDTVDSLNQAFNIASESAEMTEGEISLPVNQAIKQMITISHNYSALLLTKKIRLARVAAFLQNHNLQHSKVGLNGESPSTTAADIALFLEKLYKGVLANQEFSNKMISLLKEQELNYKLPKYLDQKIEIAHKTGELGYVNHDAGIVYSPKGNYIIVVLSESEFPDAASEKIAKVSRAVYDYFQQQ